MRKHIRVYGKILISMVFCTLLAVAFTFMQKVLLPGPGEISESVARLINGPKALFTLFGAIFLMFRLFERKEKWALGFDDRKSGSKFRKGIVFGVLMAFANFILIWSLGQAEITGFDFSPFIWEAFGIATFLAICDSFTEEALFRGYIQGLLKRSYGVTTAIIVSAIPFAVLHSLGHNVLVHPFILINLFLTGIFLALVKEKTGSLWMPIAIHIAWNLFNHVFDTTNSFIVIKLGTLDWLSGGGNFDQGLLNTVMIVGLIVLMSLQKRSRNKASTVQSN